jgi:hypothetical protein
LHAFGPFTSKDLDYFGHRAAAKKLADALGGQVQYPPHDSVTPQSAKVVATIDGIRIEIDFLVNVIGVRNPRQGAVEIVVPITTDAGPGELSIPVMHPLHCFQSRVANRLVLRRSDGTALVQADAAPIVLREYISEAIRDGDRREAMHTLNALFKYLRSDTTGRRAHEVCPVYDPAGIIDHFRADSRLDWRFRKFNLATMSFELRRRRNAMAKRARPPSTP